MPARPRPRPPCAPSLLSCLVVALVLLGAPSPAHARSPAQTVPGVSSAGDYLCRVDGACLPCPPDELHTPVCKLYGNRRPLRCIPRLASTLPASPHDDLASDRTHSPAAPTAAAERPASQPDAGRKADSADPGSGRGSGSGSSGDGARLSPAEQELRDALEADRRRRVERPLLQRRQAGAGSGVQDVVHSWEACPKVLRQEYHDYFEFIMCNLAFAVVGCALLVYRQRTLALRQFGRLAARIMQTEMT